MTFSSVAQSCPTLWDPMDCSTPGLSVHHQLPGFTQTHVHWVGDAIQASHPLSFPSPPTFNLSQQQGLFKWVTSLKSIGVSASASILLMDIQDWSPLGWTGWISLQSKGLSRVFSNTTVQKHQFFGMTLDALIWRLKYVFKLGRHLFLFFWVVIPEIYIFSSNQGKEHMARQNFFYIS